MFSYQNIFNVKNVDGHLLPKHMAWNFKLTDIISIYAMAQYEMLSNTDKYMMMSSNGNIFRVTGHLCGEFTGPRWIPRTKASDAELWCFLWSASEQTVE